MNNKEKGKKPEIVYKTVEETIVVTEETSDGIICLIITGKTHSRIEYFVEDFFIGEMAK